MWWWVGLLLGLSTRSGCAPVGVQILEQGSPISFQMGPAEQRSFRFTSCSGTEGFTVRVNSLFGNADLYVWNQPDLSMALAFGKSEKAFGEDVVSVPPLLGVREYSIQVHNVAFFTAAVEMVVVWTPTPLQIGFDSMSSASDGCSQYFSVDVPHTQFKEMVTLTAESFPHLSLDTCRWPRCGS